MIRRLSTALCMLALAAGASTNDYRVLMLAPGAMLTGGGVGTMPTTWTSSMDAAGNTLSNVVLQGDGAGVTNITGLMPPMPTNSYYPLFLQTTNGTAYWATPYGPFYGLGTNYSAYQYVGMVTQTVTMTSSNIEFWGWAGAGASGPSFYGGGGGLLYGFVQAPIGTVLEFCVPQGGQRTTNALNGGWPGGGNGVSTNGQTVFGGGGVALIKVSGMTNWMLSAGGGGANYNSGSSPGGGGGTSGMSANSGGGNQVAGGAPSGTGATAGSYLAGGNGATNVGYSTGGGAGKFGGGGASITQAAGGGSGGLIETHPFLVTWATFRGYAQAPPGTDHISYIAGKGFAALNSSGGDGLFIFHY